MMISLKLLPYELEEKILMYLDSDDIYRLVNIHYAIPEYVWLRKKHKTVEDAAKAGNIIGLKYLIDQGANHTCVLRWCVMCGHLNIVKYLVERGYQLHVHNDYILRWSVMYGNLDMVRYLVDQGADIHANNDYILCWSELYGHSDVIQYLADYGDDDLVT